MKVLVYILPLLGLLAQAQTKQEQVKRHTQVIHTITDIATRVGVPVELMLAIAWTESSYRVNLQPKLDGATPSYGLFQIKLETAQWVDSVYKHKYLATADRLGKTELNTFYACKFMKLLLKRYDGDWAKASTAYNKGHAVTGESEYWRKVNAKIHAKSH